MLVLNCQGVLCFIFMKTYFAVIISKTELSRLVLQYNPLNHLGSTCKAVPGLV